MTCRACPAGTRVLQQCNATTDRTCEQCPSGTFADGPNRKDSCQRCARCRRKEITKKECTSSSNTICTCRKGYIYHPAKPCYKCPKGLVANRLTNKCANVTSSSRQNDPKNVVTVSSGSEFIIVGCVAGILVVVVVILALILCCRRRERRRDDGKETGGFDNTPDVLKNGVQKNTVHTPPLPPKTRRRNENVYGPEPQVTRPLVEKKIISRKIPFSLVHDMNIKLSAAHHKNYKHLAGELGYSYTFVKSLQNTQQPLETLMDDYLSGPNPSKEKLYNALIAIGREDVAQMVSDDL